jgi:hypothetical protein
MENTKTQKVKDMNNETYWNKLMVPIHNTLTEEGKDKFVNFWDKNSELIRKVFSTTYIEYDTMPKKLQEVDNQLYALVKTYQK